MIGILSKVSPTAKSLSKAFDCKYWNGKRKLPGDIYTLIRWGSTESADAVEVLNPAEAIRKASNKPLCRQLLYQAGVAVPRPGTEKFPCIGRAAHHRGGNGLWMCFNKADVKRAKEQGAVYFSQYYPKTKEYRVHIGGGKVVLYSIKVGGTRDKVAWNHREDEIVFDHLPRSEWNIEIVRLAKKAIKVIGLDFGAVDILADPTDKRLPKAVVCEINTAPALSPYGIERYIKYFNRVIWTYM